MAPHFPGPKVPGWGYYGRVADFDLRPERRAAVVAAVVEALRRAVAGGRVELRGSLASGQADRFSDIDLLWTVPGGSFGAAVAGVGESLAAVAPVASVRSDPDFWGAADRRVLFVRLRGLPLFWRVDVDVRASSPVSDGAVGDGGEWSDGASAAANAVAALKSFARGRPEEARGLLERGFARVGQPFDAGEDRADEDWTEAICRLASSAAAVDPSLAEVADELVELAGPLLE
jgi:predicted nucleotidyltransferase